MSTPRIRAIRNKARRESYERWKKLSPVSGIKVHNDIQFLLDCEADCIKSGNSLSEKEKKVALDVIANIQQRMYGKEVKCLNCGCEKCWGDAYMKMKSGLYPTQTDAYNALLEERKDNPCSPKEQAGQWWDEERQADSRKEKP